MEPEHSIGDGDAWEVFAKIEIPGYNASIDARTWPSSSRFQDALVLLAGIESVAMSDVGGTEAGGGELEDAAFGFLCFRECSAYSGFLRKAP
jgi:hypothetical protein